MVAHFMDDKRTVRFDIQVQVDVKVHTSDDTSEGVCVVSLFLSLLIIKKTVSLFLSLLLIKKIW